jgi:hypothetical protein
VCLTERGADDDTRKTDSAEEELPLGSLLDVGVVHDGGDDGPWKTKVSETVPQVN